VKLLIIRPEPGASASAARARSAGFEPVILPFFEVRPRASSAPDPADFDALLISSANAVRHSGSGLQTLSVLPVHAVGKQSGEAAESAGLSMASTGLGGVDTALDAAKALGHRRLLWLCGEDRTALRPPDGIEITELVTYRSEQLPLPENAAITVADCSLAALHSVRAAKAFADFVDGRALHRDRFILAAFSPAIAHAAGTRWQGMAIASAPTDQALLSAARALVTEMAGTDARGEQD
jgi:uroporphyrinogen-III synthase